MREVVVTSAVRTAVGTFRGSLSGVPAVELGAIVIREAIQRSKLDAAQVEEIIMGNVLQAGLGQNPARQAAIKAGIPEDVPSTTINKVCGSGLKSLSLAAQAIACGDAEIIVAGGMENMTRAPYILDQARAGYKMGNGTLVDSMIKDGLSDAFHDIHMGITAENLVKRYGFTREQLDTFAVQSQQKAEKAIAEGRFNEEIVPVTLPKSKGQTVVFDKDEHARPGTTLEALSKLRPAFDAEGAVTAGNASGINDGAAAIVLMSREQADKLGLKPLAVIREYASAGVDPKVMGIGPVPAVQKVLKKSNLSISDIQLIEANEAFAAQSLAVMKDLEMNPDIVNVNGGAIALGHPIGASGTRIAVTLLHEMQRRNNQYGLATLCIGGGQGIAMLFERA